MWRYRAKLVNITDKTVGTYNLLTCKLVHKPMNKWKSHWHLQSNIYIYITGEHHVVPKLAFKICQVPPLFVSHWFSARDPCHKSLFFASPTYCLALSSFFYVFFSTENDQRTFRNPDLDLLGGIFFSIRTTIQWFLGSLGCWVINFGNHGTNRKPGRWIYG